jgi:hypothetical protein
LPTAQYQYNPLMAAAKFKAVEVKDATLPSSLVVLLFREYTPVLVIPAIKVRIIAKSKEDVLKAWVEQELPKGESIVYRLSDNVTFHGIGTVTVRARREELLNQRVMTISVWMDRDRVFHEDTFELE